MNYEPPTLSFQRDMSYAEDLQPFHFVKGTFKGLEFLMMGSQTDRLVWSAQENAERLPDLISEAEYQWLHSYVSNWHRAQVEAYEEPEIEDLWEMYCEEGDVW